jgi:hypothetical protein
MSIPTVRDKTEGRKAVTQVFAERVMQNEFRDAAYLDEEGWLVFRSEETYARYVEATGKRPSEVKAVWIDEHGLRNRHSDFQLKAKVEKELDQIRDEKHIPAAEVWRELQGMGIK